MGLAASQCRLLFITQRQNDVSAKMQKISMDRMCLARDEDDIETKYNRMLNATKYQNTNGTDISYNALMGAGAANLGQATYLTNTAGQLVLNDTYFNKLGIQSGKTSGDVNDFGVTKEKFISSMTGIDETKITEYTGLDIKTFDEWLESDEGIAALTTAGLSTEPPSNESTSVTINNEAEFYDFLKGKHLSDLTGESNGYYAGKNGGYIESNMDLSDIDNQSKSFSDGTTGQALFLGNDWTEAQQRINTICQNLILQLSSALGLSDAQQKSFLSQQSSITSMYTNFDDHHLEVDGSDRKWDSQCEKQVADACNHGNRSAYIFMKGHSENKYFAMNLKMLFDDVYAKAKEVLGSSNGTNIKFQIPGASAEEVKEWTDKAHELYDDYVAESTPDGVTEAEASKINFYGGIYDKAAAGWIYDANVGDAAQLNNKLANGTYLINGDTAENSGSLQKVKDEDAVEAAKHWYDVETKKIKRKEDAMDMENTKLQTEYQSLTSDMQSVQNIINQNIQKSFTYCSQG